MREVPARRTGAILAEAEERLARAGVPEAGASAEFLLAWVLRLGRGGMLCRSRDPLGAAARRRFLHLVRRRSRGLPLAYVLGTQNFMGLELRIRRGVLIPRPETEELVSAVLEAVPARRRGRPMRILDIGTGCGCIALALARWLPEACVYATDVSPAALALAAENARICRLRRRIRFVQADLFMPLSLGSGLGPQDRWADLIVSNPPYIPSGRIAALGPEVRSEPRRALDGGPDGLKAVRAVLERAPGMLRRGGWLALEIDDGQGREVRRRMERRGFCPVEIGRDLGGFERIALGRLA